MNSFAPTFSVVVPVYNHAPYVGAALDSILAQTDPDWEAVVVDDGSTDGTPRIVDQYARQDPRIRVYHKPNGGVASALNRGVSEARGEWICWLSSDDLFERTKLEVHREWMRRRSDVRFFFTDFLILDHATGRSAPSDKAWTNIPPREWQVLSMLRTIYVNGITMCLHRDVFKVVGLFKEDYRLAQDFEFFLRVLVRYEALFIPQATCKYRSHVGQGVQVHSEAMFLETGRAAQEFINAHSFEQMLAFCPVGDLDARRNALRMGMEVASDPYGYLYALGAHPALIGRILEWVGACPGVAGRALRHEFGMLARSASLGHKATLQGVFWQAAAVAVEALSAPYPYHPVDVHELAILHCRRLRALNEPKAGAMAEYLTRRLGLSLAEADDRRAEHPRSLVLAYGADLTDPASVPARLAARQAGILAASGHSVILFSTAREGFGWLGGLPVLGSRRPIKALLAFAAAVSVDAVLGLKRRPFLRWPFALLNPSAEPVAEPGEPLLRQIEEASGTSVVRPPVMRALKGAARCLRAVRGVTLEIAVRVLRAAGGCDKAA